VEIPEGALRRAHAFPSLADEEDHGLPLARVPNDLFLELLDAHIRRNQHFLLNEAGDAHQEHVGVSK
jgi:hypothetical protein